MTADILQFPNSYEITGRREKAEAIAAVLQAWNLGSDVVAEFTDDQWELARKAAERFRWDHDPNAPRMGTPSREAREQVIRILRKNEDAALQRLEHLHGR